LNKEGLKFYRWGGGGVKHRWSFGWLTGIDNDLVCVSPNVRTRAMEYIALSPVCFNRLLALIAFLLKVLLFRLDWNLRG